jgi:hypothetical protein
MVILYIYSTSWRMKSVFYERQQSLGQAKWSTRIEKWERKKEELGCAKKKRGK